MAAKYQAAAAQIQTWNGVVKVDPDGLVQQVTWQVSTQGIYTTAATNTEPSITTPPYPARRQRENLAADPNAALANARELNILTMRGGAVAAGNAIGGRA
jgi:hypothetical protein